MPAEENTKEAPAPNPAATEWLRMRQDVEKASRLAAKYVQKQNLDTTWMLVAHLGIHSGLPRMALVRIRDGSLADSGCVAHGYGSEAFSTKAVFSNTPNSYCSSLGRYRVGKSYIGNFGKAFKLHGLDATNSNAFARFVVLHSYQCVPDRPPFPDFICNSQGCPMVSPIFFQRLAAVIDRQPKPLLLWVLE